MPTDIFLDYTTEEYFKKRRDALFKGAQERIASACLTYLTFTDFQNGPCTNVNEFISRILTYPLYIYAARNWGYHMHKSGEKSCIEPCLALLYSRLHLEASLQAILAEGFEEEDHYTRKWQLNAIPMNFSPLHMASHFGLRETADYLLRSGVEIDAKDSMYRTPLWLSASLPYEDVVRLLIDKGARTDIKDLRHGQSPIHVASRKGHIAIFKLLLDNGADIEDTTRNGETALMLAVEHGQEAAVRLLLKFGANVEAKCTPLIRAARQRNETMVKILIEEGRADVNVKDRDGTTALLHSISTENISMVRILLERGADMNTKNNSGESALFITVKYCYNQLDDLMKLLLQSGADVNTTNNEGRSVLTMAVYGSLEGVELLLENGADVNIIDDEGSTALSKALERGETAIAELLLRSGAQIEPAIEKFRLQDMPLVWAVTNRNELLVKLLVKYGADLNAKDDGGRTALMWAASYGCKAIARTLIKPGTDVNARDTYGSTALMNAVRVGNEAIAKLLIENGADVNQRDSRGRTALLLAKKKGYDGIVKILIDRGADEFEMPG